MRHIKHYLAEHLLLLSALAVAVGALITSVEMLLLGGFSIENLVLSLYTGYIGWVILFATVITNWVFK